MLYAQIFEEFLHRLNPPGLHIFIASLNSFYCFPIILLFPSKVIG